MTKNLLRFITESNAIEGICREPLPHEIKAHETFLALKTITIPGLEAFVNAVAEGAPLRRGKSMNVRVGNHRPPPGGPEIKKQLKLILAHASDGDHPWNVHMSYETLHPFMDGNGRSGRVLWAWQMIDRYGEIPDIGFLHMFYYQTLERSRP